MTQVIEEVVHHQQGWFDPQENFLSPSYTYRMPFNINKVKIENKDLCQRTYCNNW